MKIAVIAANGRSGRAFVNEALANGHHIVAGILGVNPFPSHDRLKVMNCDATNTQDVMALIKGQDAVVSLIGHVHGSSINVQAAAMHTLVDAMHRSDVQRIVSLTGTGVRFPDDKVTVVDAVLNAIVKLVDSRRIEDGLHHAEVLQKSKLDWTIIRVLKLTNGIAKPYRLREQGPTKRYVSRTEVALAILEVLKKGTFKKKAPIIGVING